MTDYIIRPSASAALSSSTTFCELPSQKKDARSFWDSIAPAPTADDFFAVRPGPAVRASQLFGQAVVVLKSKP
jgi:hypothetical protein